MIQLIASESNITAAFEWAVSNQLKLKIAYAKTYIGKTNKGFSFLGYFLQPGKGLQVARKNLNNCAQRISRLYEQGAPERAHRQVRAALCNLG